MTGNPRDRDEEIERALDILDAAGSEENGKEIDAAFQTLVRLLPPVSPRHGFSERVVTAVRSAPLPAGRRKLRARSPVGVAVLTGAAVAAAVGGALWAMPFIQLFIAQIFLSFIRGSVLAIRSVSFVPGVWKWMDLTTRALTAIIGSTEMLSVFAAVTLLSLLNLAALARLVSASRPERSGY